MVFGLLDLSAAIVFFVPFFGQKADGYVQAIGPQGSTVGFAALNSMVHKLTGVYMQLYTITDWQGLVTVAFGFGFALLGLAQWIKRKNILKVDRSILILAAFYIVTLAAYLENTFVILYHCLKTNH